ncbi:hypothetical protein ACOMHN_007936 [Nucella lapillus]
MVIISLPLINIIIIVIVGPVGLGPGLDDDFAWVGRKSSPSNSCLCWPRFLWTTTLLCVPLDHHATLCASGPPRYSVCLWTTTLLCVPLDHHATLCASGPPRYSVCLWTTTLLCVPLDHHATLCASGPPRYSVCLWTTTLLCVPLDHHATLCASGPPRYSVCLWTTTLLCVPLDHHATLCASGPPRYSVCLWTATLLCVHEREGVICRSSVLALAIQYADQLQTHIGHVLDGLEELWEYAHSPTHYSVSTPLQDFYSLQVRDEPTPTHGKHSVTCCCLDIALLRASLVWGLGVSDSKEKFCWSGFTTFFLVLGGMFLCAFGVGYTDTGDCHSTSSAEIHGSASCFTKVSLLSASASAWGKGAGEDLRQHGAKGLERICVSMGQRGWRGSASAWGKGAGEDLRQHGAKGLERKVAWEGDVGDWEREATGVSVAGGW